MEVASTWGGYLEKGHENASSDLKASISLEGPCKERIMENPRAALKQEEICLECSRHQCERTTLTGNYSLIYWQKHRTNILKFQIGPCAHYDRGHDEQFTFIREPFSEQ